MFKIDDVKMYPMSTTMISVPQNEDVKYNIIFMSENSDFLSSYYALNIKPHFVRRITAVPFKVPRLIATVSTLTRYKSLGLIPILDVRDNNVFIDAGPFIDLVDNTYGKGSYRRPMVFSKIINYLAQCRQVGENRKNVLIYHIDLNKQSPDNIFNTRAIVLSLMAKIGEGQFPFNSVLLAIQTGGTVKYTGLYSKNYQLNPGRILSIFKHLIGTQDVPEETEETEQEEPTTQYEESTKMNLVENVNEALSDRRKKQISTVLGGLVITGALALYVMKVRGARKLIKQKMKRTTAQSEKEALDNAFRTLGDDLQKAFEKASAQSKLKR